MGELEVRHNCGLVVAHTLNDAYNMINSLQHRGREAAGIAAISDDRIDVVKWVGRVSKFDLIDLEELLPQANYNTFFAHVRYATKGRKDKILEDAHPHTLGGTKINKGSHVIIYDCDMAIIHNGQINEKFFDSIDKSKLETTCDTEAILHLLKYIGMSEENMLKTIPGSYTLAFAEKNKKNVVVMRDSLGMMPGAIGKKNGKYLLASEDIAFNGTGAEFEKYLDPGSIYEFYHNGKMKRKNSVQKKENLSKCMFQYNYIANVNSTLDDVGVSRIRRMLGEQLAKEFSPDVDLVTYLPRCPKTAAESYAEVRGLEFIMAFYKMRSERSFQGPTIEDRARSIDENLFLNDSLLDKINGKKILVIDDSTIRGNNSKKALKLLQDAGASEIILANYTPKIGIIGNDGIERGCDFGVDMPADSKDFIARGRTDEEISKLIGAKTYFMSIEGMLETFERAGISRNNLCYYCIGGEHPFSKK